MCTAETSPGWERTRTPVATNADGYSSNDTASWSVRTVSVTDTAPSAIQPYPAAGTGPFQWTAFTQEPGKPGNPVLPPLVRSAARDRKVCIRSRGRPGGRGQDLQRYSQICQSTSHGAHMNGRPFDAPYGNTSVGREIEHALDTRAGGETFGDLRAPVPCIESVTNRLPGSVSNAAPKRRIQQEPLD